MSETAKNFTDMEYTPEDYFTKRKDYLEFYYKQESETRAIRQACLKLAKDNAPQGTASEKILEFSNTFYNWIINYGKQEESRS